MWNVATVNQNVQVTYLANIARPINSDYDKKLSDYQINTAALYCSIGFAGYVTICVQLYCVTEQTNNKEKASRQKHTQETTKLTKENSTGKTQVSKKHIYNSTKNSINNNISCLTHPTDGNVQSVTTCKKGKKAAKQNPSGI
jgi:hypothetical protein